MEHALNWFEIPVTEMGRAQRFYGEILGREIVRVDSGGSKVGLLPSDGGVGGALVQTNGYTPSETGSLVYLKCGNDLAPALARVEPAGGKVLLPKTEIGPHGFCAQFLDSEGNRVGLHSVQ